jgi:hypothetical protein
MKETKYTHKQVTGLALLAAFTPPLMLSNESLTKKAKKVTGTFFHSDNHEPEYNQTHFLHKER